jgi:hypothetical protein
LKSNLEADRSTYLHAIIKPNTLTTISAALIIN